MRYCNCHRPPPLWMRFIFFFCFKQTLNEGGRHITYKRFFKAVWIIQLAEFRFFGNVDAPEMLKQLESLFATAPPKPKLTLVKKEEPK